MKHARLRVYGKDDVTIVVDCKHISYAARPDQTKPAIVFVDGISEAFTLVEVFDMVKRDENQPEFHAI